MNINVERKANSKAVITITILSDDMAKHLEVAFEKQASRIAIPGFRPGKAPKNMVEARINPQLLQQDAVDLAIDKSYRQALNDESLEPLEQGSIEDYKFNDDGSFTYTVNVTLRPEVFLKDYKGITVNVNKTEVKDEQVEGEIERIVAGSTSFGEVKDSGIIIGDYVTIDYNAKVDGEIDEELSTTGYPLEVGNDTFFPELNEGLLGLKADEEKVIDVKYKKTNANEKLAGKSVSYEIKVAQVRRMIRPEVTDEWVTEMSGGEITTVDDLKERIKQNLVGMAAQSDREHARNEILRMVVEGAELDIPDVLADEELAHLIDDFDSRLMRSHMTIEEYAEQAKKSVDDIRTEQQIMARDMVRRSLVMQEVARRENLLVTKEDLDSMIQILAASNNMKSYKMKKELEKNGQINNLANRLFQEKIFAFLEENANIVGGDEQSTPSEDAPKPKKPRAKKTDAEGEVKEPATEEKAEKKPRKSTAKKADVSEKVEAPAEEKPKKPRAKKTEEK